jgi:hypothetical protein
MEAGGPASPTRADSTLPLNWSSVPKGSYWGPVVISPCWQRSGVFVGLLSVGLGMVMKETCPVRQSANSNRSVDFGAKANLWRVTLSRIPSLFGRLAYFASLRDPATGEYQHWGMSEVYGRQAANKAFRQSHAAVFREWLSLDHAQREADFGLYRSGLEAEGFNVLEVVARFESHRRLVPVPARQAESEVFQRALIALLERVRHASAVQRTPARRPCGTSGQPRRSRPALLDLRRA